MKRPVLALGATETETYFRVSLPAARSGVAAAVVLGVGRAIGEAMAIIMVAGNVANMPGLFTSVRFLTTGIISGDVRCRRGEPVSAGAVFHRAGAVSVHHAHQRPAECLHQTQEGGLSHEAAMDASPETV